MTEQKLSTENCYGELLASFLLEMRLITRFTPINWWNEAIEYWTNFHSIFIFLYTQVVLQVMVTFIVEAFAKAQKIGHKRKNGTGKNGTCKLNSIFFDLK